MGMTECLDVVLYDKRDFLYNSRASRHPMELTEKHFTYHLYRNALGCLDYMRAENNNRVRSPRSLNQLCLYSLVNNLSAVKKLHASLLPSTFHPLLLSEAIFQREAAAVEWLVSTWPMRLLRVYDILPLEDYLEDNYLTLPLEEGRQTCLLDCFITGLLKLRPEAGLRYIDFRKFEKDRTLCKELCRLPILWMKPENRTAENIHDLMSDTLDVEKDKVQRYLNRIDIVYQAIDADFQHESTIGPIKVLLDLKMSIDDVPLGLSLQKTTPFKFAGHRLWMKHIQDVALTPCNLDKVIDIARLTHFEFDDPILPRDEKKFRSVLGALGRLRNLQALSLPNALDVACNAAMPGALGAAIRQLKHLQRLSIAHSNLHGYLRSVLVNLPQRLVYLNLRDCRLAEEDLFFLINWPSMRFLQELNLSCNNLQYLDQVLIAALERMPLLTCFSVSNCMLSLHSQVLLSREFLYNSKLKVICMQSYVPLPRDDLMEVLSVCASVPRLQKLLLLPGAYAFPGNSLQDRRENKIHTLLSCYRYLELRGRGDVELE